MVSGILQERPHRASGDLAYHVLESMLAVRKSSEEDSPVRVKSDVLRPAPLLPGLPLGKIGD
jgi:hypothetical protein